MAKNNMVNLINIIVWGTVLTILFTILSILIFCIVGIWRMIV